MHPHIQTFPPHLQTGKAISFYMSSNHMGHRTLLSQLIIIGIYIGKMNIFKFGCINVGIEIYMPAAK